MPSSSGLTNELEDEDNTILQNIIICLLSMTAYIMFSTNVVGLLNVTSALMVLCLLSVNYIYLI